MIDFKRVSVHSDAVTGHPLGLLTEAVFPSQVTRADCAISAFFVAFSEDDRPLFVHEVSSRISTIVDNRVDVAVDVQLRDKSGFFDDPYLARVDVLVTVDRVLQNAYCTSASVSSKTRLSSS